MVKLHWGKGTMKSFDKLWYALFNVETNPRSFTWLTVIAANMTINEIRWW